MKIVSIFADKLFAFHFEDEWQNELDRLLTQWTDTSYLKNFVTNNIGDLPKGKSVQAIVLELIDNAYEIEALLDEIADGHANQLDIFFKPLNDLELQIPDLSKRKGRRNYFRLYAIRIDESCYIITGGAIKFHHKNYQRPHTLLEMEKIEKCRNYLKENGISDSETFYELINEQQ